MLDMLNQSLSDDMIRQVSQSIGANQKATETAISGALPVLLNALSRNTVSSSGADSLLGALGRDHDGSILDDIGGFLGNASAGPGDGILGHVLGGRRGNVETGLSRMSGLDLASIAKLLAILAPIVMGVLGRTKQQQGLDASGLAAALGGEQRAAQQAAPDAMKVFADLLDTDGDGQVMDNVAQLGTSLLGTFLSSRR
jgi:hypothetical protein